MQRLISHEKVETAMVTTASHKGGGAKLQTPAENLVVDCDPLIVGAWGHAQRLSDERSTLAVLLAKRSNRDTKQAYFGAIQDF